MVKFYLSVCLVIALLASCVDQNDLSDKSVFHYNQLSGITSLDPAFSKDQANIWAVNQIFNGLVQFNDSLEVLPCIANKWEIKDAGHTYIFYLRNDVFFHDHELFKEGKGKKVTAHDFVYSFNRIISPKVASPGAWIFNDKVVLAENRVASAWGGARHAVPFEAINDTTFKINLTKPFPPLLGLLCMQYCSVVPFEIVENFGKKFRNNPIGTGPFKFDIWRENVCLILKKNENYFEFDGKNKLPYLDAVQISFLPDKQTAYFEFLKGNIDFFSGIDLSYKDELFTKLGTLRPKYKEKFKISTHSYLNTEYLGILVDPENEIVKKSPLRIKKIRQAINYAIDRKKMMTYLRNNIGYPANAGFVPRGIPAFSDTKVKGYEFAPDTALKLLREAGFPEGKGLPTITLYTNKTYLDLCEFIHSQLEEVGIKVNLDVMPPATLRNARDKSKLEFFRSSWIADYADAENFLALFYSKNHTPNGPNFTHFSNEEFDSLYVLTIAEVDEQKRYDYYHRMDQIIVDEAPVVVLYYDKVVRLYHHNVSGLGNNAMNLLTLKRVKVN
ncbi:MAG: ABC transporter substrate-binding protein [Bacteroidetes bacterium]|nr:MAG: ABC transporter substrate-binding protein [Bacteroidota bacterium]